MGLLLEIKSGPFAGKLISLASGQSIVIGRAAAKSQFALPHDTFMSGAHFSVEAGPQGCRVIDHKSSNGTFLNGAKIGEAMLANGDEIKSGQTVFSVRIVADDQLPTISAPIAPPPAPLSPSRSVSPTPASSPPPAVAPSPAPKPLPTVDRTADADNPAVASAFGHAAPSAGASPRSAPAPPPAPQPAPRPSSSTPYARPGQPAALRIGNWSFAFVPSGWEVQEGLGIQSSGKDEFPSTVVAAEELLGSMTLQQFVEAQIGMLRQYLREPSIGPSMPPRVSGADDTMAVDIRHSTKDGKELVYHRIYARSASIVGVLTVTTLGSDLARVLQSLQPFLDSASLRLSSP